MSQPHLIIQVLYSQTLQVYILQHMDFAIQMARHGKIVDLYAGKKYHNDVFAVVPDKAGWEVLLQWLACIVFLYLTHFRFDSYFFPLQDELRAVCNFYRTLQGTPESLAILSYLNKFGLQNITRDFSVRSIVLHSE